MDGREKTLQVDEELDAKIRAATGLVSNRQLDASDVFIVGYMKSGTTWLRNLVAGVIYGACSEYVPYSLVYDLVPNYGPKKPYYKRYRTPMFFKTHDFPEPQFKRVVYLLRDGRDVLVSLHKHLQAMRGKEIDFLNLARGQGAFTTNYKWHKHVEAWLKNPYQAQMLVIKYEDLKKDTLHELRRFCEFAGIERDDALLERVAVSATFEKMREKETRLGINNRGWPQDQFFVRRGQVGSHKDEMPPEVLEAFLQDAGDTLRRVGYL